MRSSTLSAHCQFGGRAVATGRAHKPTQRQETPARLPGRPRKIVRAAAARRLGFCPPSLLAARLFSSSAHADGPLRGATIENSPNDLRGDRNRKTPLLLAGPSLDRRADRQKRGFLHGGGFLPALAFRPRFE